MSLRLLDSAAGRLLQVAALKKEVSGSRFRLGHIKLMSIKQSLVRVQISGESGLNDTV